MEIETTELQELEKRIKQEKSRRMFERYQALRLYLLGTDSKQIAFTIGRTERSSTPFRMRLGLRQSTIGHCN